MTSFTAGPAGQDSVPQAGFARALLERAAERGCDLGQLPETGAAPRPPAGADGAVPGTSPRAFSRFCRTLFSELGDEAVGYMPDGPAPPGTTRLLALSLLGSASLGEAMRRAIEFNACCRLGRRSAGPPVENRLWIDRERREARLSYRCAVDSDRAHYDTLCGLAMWLRFCSWLIGRQIDVTAAACAAPEPSTGVMPGIRQFLHCPVRYGQVLNSVSFSTRHLEAGPVRDEAALEAFLADAPYHILVEPRPGEHSITHRIHGLLGDDFRLAMPSFEELTGLLNMSARTLRRRLEREGTTYQRIKDNARRDAAITLLTRRGMSVSEVAERVGFSDPSAFHRSFKKWTGQAPGAFR